MTVSRRLIELLEQAGLDYEVTKHTEAFTAQEVAAAEHVPGKEWAKVVVIMAADEPVMAVLPASYRVNFEKFKELAGVASARLATEEEFADLFPGCEVGAMPPFGQLYDLPLYADEVLEEDETITFNAGTHTETVTMTFDDWEELAEPEIGDFAEHV